MNKAQHRYPLSVRNVSNETYIFMSKGHQDVHAFIRAIRAAGYHCPLRMPTHEWTRIVPASRWSEFEYMYREAEPFSRGAFPVTYAREAFDEDVYEAKSEGLAPSARTSPAPSTMA